MMNTNRINVWRTLYLAGTISLLISYVIQWTQMISTPALRTGTDFIAFYAAGQVANRYGFSSVYNIDLQREVEQNAVGFTLGENQVLLYNHGPYLIPLLGLLVDDNYVESFVRWLIVLIGVYIFGTIVLNKALLSGEERVTSGILASSILTYYPVFMSLLLGQDTAFIFLGGALWCKGILDKQDWVAGAGLALATIKPQIGIALAIPFLFRYPKVWWRFFVFAGVLAFFSLLLIGPKEALSFVNLLLTSAQGNWYGFNQAAMLNILGLLIRTFPGIEIDSLHIIGWAGYFVGISLNIILWVRSKASDERLLGISILVVTLTVPHLHYHDLTLLIFPLLLAMKHSLGRISKAQLALIPLGLSFLLFFTSSIPLLYFTLPYVIYTVLARSLIRPPKQTNYENTLLLQ